MKQSLVLRPKRLKPGDTLGVFTPSSPAYSFNEELFANGIRTLENLGFRIKLGGLTSRRESQGYRSGKAQARAKELMDLIEDPSVHGVISTIGGMNSASLIPHLDFDKIRSARKVFCGFSDVTSLHLAILHFSGLKTIYGPSLMCWFGEWPNGIPESSEWFLDAVSRHVSGTRKIQTPLSWSNHKRRWDNGDWKNLPREWTKNDGWRILNAGHAEAPILALNFNTLMSAAGTPYWPDFEGKILLLEDMDAPQARTERIIQQLKFTGAFERLAGLLVGKPEFYDPQGASFGYDELFLEMLGPRPYPIVSNFDCGHTVPMISIPQLSRVRLEATGGQVELEILEPGVE